MKEWSKLVASSPNAYGLVEVSWRHQCSSGRHHTHSKFVAQDRTSDVESVGCFACATDAVVELFDLIRSVHTTMNGPHST